MKKINSLLLVFLLTFSFAKSQKKTKIFIQIYKYSFNSLKYQLSTPSSQNDIINLKYSENKIYFVLETKDSTVEYKLEGIDYGWIPAKQTQHIHYSNLEGNTYEFKVKTKNETQSIKFVIEPPFWQKWWFFPSIFLYILFVLGAVYYIFFYYRLRQQLKTQSVRHELEIKALRAQMNPHFIFNCMNTIDAYILRKKFLEASDYLQKFSKLIRKILENSENQTISIEQEVQTLKLYIELEQERFSDSFSYHFEVEPDLMANDYQIPSLVLQPFVENAILHGIRHLTERKGLITVILKKLKGEKNEDILYCQIRDNGIGRKASAIVNEQRQASHKSMGVNVTLERINTYQAIYGNKMETIVSDLDEGTKVEIKLPLFIGD